MRSGCIASGLDSSGRCLDDLLVDSPDRGYKVTLSKLGPHSVDWQVRAWVKTSDTGLAQEVLTVAIKKAWMPLDFASLIRNWKCIGPRMTLRRPPERPTWSPSLSRRSPSRLSRRAVARAKRKTHDRGRSSRRASSSPTSVLASSMT